MRSILLILCGGLIAVGVVLGGRATAPSQLSAAAAAATTGDKAALGKAIREYLIANPEVLVEAMQELERKQDSQRDTVAQKAIQENQRGAAERSREPDRRQSRTATSRSSSSATTSAPTASAPTPR